MKAEIIEYSGNELGSIAERINALGIGIIPSDTIYSLSGKVDGKVEKRLYDIKGRDHGKAFIVLMNKDQLKKSGLVVPSEILSLWPAPFTAILNRKGGGTLAVRVPDDGFLSGLLKLTGPIYSTSVNISGERELRSLDEIVAAFQDRVDFIVDDPSFAPKGASTLIDATKSPFRVIREGLYDFGSP